MNCVCQYCNREYEFIVGKRQGHTKTTCNSCMVNRRRFQKRQQLIEEAGGECELCGYDRCTKALHFHHKDAKEKLFNISGSHGYSMGALREEAKKCILICANCHAEAHASVI